MKVWLAVTADKYELPLAVFSTAGELGRWAGLSRNTVESTASKKLSGRNKGYKIIKVEVDANE